MFVKTYAKKKTLLGLALDICEGTSEVNECTSEVNQYKSEVNKAIKQYLYQRERRTSGKFPPEFQ